jgi:TatD DNase family protein
MYNYIDTHVHLGDFVCKEKLLNELLKRKQYALSMTNLPEQYIELKRILNLRSNKYIKYALGYHPREVTRNKFNSFLFTKHFSSTDYVGEVGLDFSKDYFKYSNEQIKVFRYICRLAKNNKKILSIHSLKAENEVFNILKENNINTVIIHWFTGNLTIAEYMINEGYYFSFNKKMLLSKKGKDLFRILPKDRILVESDAPYTISNFEDYFKEIDIIYNVIRNNNISAKQIFMNFKKFLDTYHINLGKN